ncbi:hypothetical protein [Microbacterium sp. GXF6406]
MGSLFNAGASTVVLLIIIAIAAFVWRLGRGVIRDRTHVIRVTGRLAWAATAVLALSAVIGLIVDLTVPSVTMSVPFMNAWPLPLPGVEAQTDATIDSTSVAHVTAALSGLAMRTRLLWAIGQFLTALLPAVIALLVAFACHRLNTDAPFSAVLIRTTTAAASSVLGLGFTGPVLRGIAGSMASYEAFGISTASWEDAPRETSISDVLPEPTVLVPFDGWPIGVAIALFVFAALLRAGQRLQRETEGLV